MRTMILLITLLGATYAQADSNCKVKAEKALSAVALLEDNLRFVPENVSQLPDSTETGGEGDAVATENYSALMGDITSAQVSMYKNSCAVLKIEVSYGE